VKAFFLKRTEFILRERIVRLIDFLGSPDFMSKAYSSFQNNLLKSTLGVDDKGSPRMISNFQLIKFETGGLVEQLFMDVYQYEFLPLINNLDISLLHMHELFDMFDSLESIRRRMELGIRLDLPDRKKAINSNMWVLKNLEKIQCLSEKKLELYEEQYFMGDDNRKIMNERGFHTSFRFKFE